MFCQCSNLNGYEQPAIWHGTTVPPNALEKTEIRILTGGRKMHSPYNKDSQPPSQNRGVLMGEGGEGQTIPKVPISVSVGSWASITS